MGLRRARAQDVVDLADSAVPSGEPAGAGLPDVLDLTQDDEAAAAAAPPPTAAVPPAAGQPKRKRKSKAAAAHAGEPSGAGAAAEPSPGRKKQKAVKEKRTNEYGRTVPYSAKPSQKVRERVTRALPGSGHRLFLISRNTVAPIGAEGGPVEEFVVLGATGSVYTVKVGRHPSCSCPDAAKGNLCKHHLFIMLRVLRLPQDDPVVWQRALLKSEADEVMSGNRSTRASDVGVLASDAVQRAYRQATDEAVPEQDAAGSQAPNRSLEDAECAICFDDLQDGASAAQKAIVTCEACGNHLHKECFSKWASAKRQQGLEVTCVYCRSTWVTGVIAGSGGGRGIGYLDLSQHSEQHRNPQSLNELYGASAVWINYHARGGNARHAARMFEQLRG